MRDSDWFDAESVKRLVTEQLTDAVVDLVEVHPNKHGGSVVRLVSNREPDGLPSGFATIEIVGTGSFFLTLGGQFALSEVDDNIDDWESIVNDFVAISQAYLSGSGRVVDGAAKGSRGLAIDLPELSVLLRSID